MKNSLFEQLDDACDLPTPSGVVFKLLEMTRDDKATAREIADVISVDPGLTARILRFANSPMAGVRREVTSVQHAITLMGMRGVGMMALSFAFLNPKHASACDGFNHQQFAIHSLACAVTARGLAEVTGTLPPQDAFVAGLLSQLGRATLAAALPDEYAKVLAKAKSIPGDLPPLERDAFGKSYPAVGAWLLAKWGIPESTCAAIRSFRNDVDGPDELPLANVLHVAERAAGIICPAPANSSFDLAGFLESANRRLRLGAEESTEILESAAAALDDARKTFELRDGSTRTVEQIETEVRERVAELGIAIQMENQRMAVQQKDLMRRVKTDALTFVGNRAAFDERLAMEVERCVRSSLPLALLMIDVDRFKRFNDTHGHQAGDCVLRSVAKTLDDQIRKVDFLARYGGEEFAVIAPDTRRDGVEVLAERLRSQVERLAVPWNGRPLSVTISIGAAIFPVVGDADDASRIVQQADEQLYKAKRAGRNRVEIIVDGAPAEAVGANSA